MRGRNIKPPATYKPKNEVTRHFEAILAEREDPDFKQKQAIIKNREAKANDNIEDLGL